MAPEDDSCRGVQATVAAEIVRSPELQFVRQTSWPYVGQSSAAVRGRSGLALFSVGESALALQADAPTTMAEASEGPTALSKVRHLELATQADARYLFQLLFTDLDLVAFGQSGNPQLVPFATMGLVTTDLVPKPALASSSQVNMRPGVFARISGL